MHMQGLSTVDNYWADPRYCTLPTPTAPAVNTSTMPASYICQQDMEQNGWNQGVYNVPIYQIGTFNPNAVGMGMVFITYNKRMYITMTFSCNYIFNTESSATSRAVEIGLWSSANASLPLQ